MFQQGFFQIDPNLTPEELQRRREMIQAMMPDGRAQYVGEGLGDLGKGIFAGLMGRKLNKVERDNRQKATDLIGGLMGGGSPSPVSGPLTVLGMQPDITSGPIDSGQDVANDTMLALGKQPLDPAANIRAGLIARGLPEHVADGFIMNIRDESGFKTDINEVAPVVPGSRGGYGLIQWTGPRRRQLEEFAASRGTSVSDLNTQLDFLVSELQGSEANAGRSILSTKTAPEAAVAVLNDFLRPAEEHRLSRERAYLGGAAPAAQPATQPAAQPRVGGTAELYAALQNPWLTTQQRAVVMSMIQQREAEEARAREAADPMRQLALEKAQLEVDALRNPQFNADRYKVVGNTLYDLGAEGGPTPIGKGEAGPGQTMEFTMPDGTRVRVGANGLDGATEVGTIPQGYEMAITADGQRVMRPIAGGPEDTSQEDEAKRQAAISTTDVLNNAALRAREAARDRNFGSFGQGLAAMVPWTDSAEVARQVEVLKSQAKIQNLNAMRAASPTGGALGSVTEKEGQMLADASGALDPNSPNFERDLADYYRTLLRVVHGQEAGDEIFDQMWSDQKKPPPGNRIRYDAQGNPMP